MEIWIEKVMHTVLEGMVLVLLVMYVLVEKIRYRVIGRIVVGIWVLGGFAFM